MRAVLERLGITARLLGLDRAFAADIKPWSRRSPDWWCLVALLTLVTLVFCAHYDKWSAESWGIPVNYVGGRTHDMVFTGDALWGMANAKAMAEGEIAPIALKAPASLGAPFGANWNDWPTFEESINAWWSLLIRLFGVFAGSNLVLLSAHLLAAATFYWVCRHMRYHAAIAFAGAALFALTRYAFWRNLPNLSLTFYWHVPLALLVAWWCIRERSILYDPRKLLAAGAVAAVHGLQSPYYSGMLMQLLFWAGIYAALRWRDWKRLIPPVAIGAALMGTLVIANIDTLYSSLTGGANSGAAVRAYYDLERYALRPIELLLPRSHSIEPLQRWVNESYFGRALIAGEDGSPYAGIIGIVALAALVGATANAAVRRGLREVPVHFWAVGLVTAFCVIGGLNGIVGLFGFQLFRASNRYSIVIVTVLLLFLVKQLTSWTRRWNFTPIAALAAIVTAVGIYDQLPPRDPMLEAEGKKAWHQDQKLMAEVQRAFPPGAMFFQLPVHDFPESYKTGEMDDYEHFRPYLHSRGYRFSYGDIKGRFRERWLKDTELQGAAHLVDRLTAYGFSALFINRPGYDRQLGQTLDDLRNAGVSRLVAYSDEWICLALNPSLRRTLPPVFGEGWFPLEKEERQTVRWSSGDAILTLHNPSSKPRTARLKFGLGALDRRSLEISTPTDLLYETIIEPDLRKTHLDFSIRLQPGSTVVHFKTDRPPEFPRNGDPRKLAFQIIDFVLQD